MTLEKTDRDKLDGLLAELIGEAGWQTFVSAPLIEPNDASFPDRFSKDAQGVGVTALRLLRHARVADATVKVVDFTALSPPRIVDAAEVHFTRIHADTVYEFELITMGNPADLMGALCHEVGAAWQAHKRIGYFAAGPFRTSTNTERLDHEDAAANASVAAVYLGFGIPATNAAHVARHGGKFEGHFSTTEWAVTMAGGLKVEAMAYLVAVQLTVRSRKPEHKGVLGHLSVNQRALVERWLEELEGDAEEVRQRLGIPDPERWPDVSGLDATPIDRGDVDVEVAVDPDETRNRGRPVFRIRKRQISKFGGVGSVGGLLAGSLALVFANIPGIVFLGAIGTGMLCGAAHGFRTFEWECSDSSCTHPLTPKHELCPGCGGTISGELTNANERLEAEERLEEETGEAP